MEVIVGRVVKRMKQYECSNCGCVFEVDDTEGINRTWACECPNCGILTMPNTLTFRVQKTKEE